MFARLIKKGADAHFLCFPGMKKTDSNTIFQIQRETQIALTEATLLLSVVHMFLKMGGVGGGRGGIHPPTQAQRRDGCAKLVNKLNASYVSLAAAFLFWVMLEKEAPPVV